ncbi:MAG: DUF4956 domain-containing protein [bacterium]|nr:DUF4956 domain-containing protein [bacterium]
MNQFLDALDSSNRWHADFSFEATIISLLLAFVLGQVIAWTYARTHSGLSYSRSFTQSLVLMTMVIAMVMYVIGNSLVTAFGLLGALAMIRFRNVLKDTRDTVFVFIALVVGMAVGSQRFLTAVLGAAAISLAVAYLNVTSFGTLGRYDGYLTLRLAALGEAGASNALLNRFCRAIKEVSTRQSGEDEGAEFVYQIGLRDRMRSQEMLKALRDLDGVTHVSLVLRNELSEV